MIFKKLELHGFKTFFDRTEVHFKPGINAVVGPNGCGKSNIADAIRWVLGEQSPKQLRGEKMEDLIFSGSQTRHPLGMAEVSLTVELTGEELPVPYNVFSEICVTRRLYRSGESEYFINNAACRLRDIRELFLDTGLNPKAYAVISQGNIGSLVDAHPEDRRVLLEEAAGIAKFKERKAAALRKLDATEQNLVRLNDLTAEIKRQLGSLQRQARRTERFHELQGQHDALEVRILVHQHDTLLERVSSHADKIRSLDELQDSLKNESATLEAGLEAGSLESVQVEQSLGGLREEFYAHRSRLESLEQQLDTARGRLAGLQQSLASDRTESERLAVLLAVHATDLTQVGQEVSGLQESLSAQEELRGATEARLAEAAHEARERKEALDEASGRYRDGVRVESEAQRALARLEARAEAIDRELDRVAGELAALEAEDRVLATREEDLARLLSSERESFERNAAKTTAAAGDLVQAREEAAVVESALSAARDELNASTARLASLSELERNLSGWPELFQEELSRILTHRDLDGGLRGILADALQVPAEHEIALEAVLGERLKFLLVNAPEIGIEAARVLQEGTAVRGTFLPIAPRRVGGEPAAAATGGLPRLIDVVTTPRDLRPLAEHLLRDVHLVGSLAAAIAIWREGAPGCTFVTPLGEVLWPDGSVTAGRLDPSRELLPLVRSIRETQAIATAAGAQTSELGERQGAVRERVITLDQQARTLEQEGRAIGQQIASLEKDLLFSRQKRGAQATQRERLTELSDRVGVEREQVQLDLDRERSRRNDLAAARARHEEELLTLEADFSAHLLEERSLMEQLAALQVQLAAGSERAAHLGTRREHLVADSARATHRRAELAAAMEEALAAAAAAATAVDALAGDRAILAEERDRIEARLNEAQDRHRQLTGRARETEERLRLMRARREEIQAELVTLQVRLAEEQVRREHFHAQVVELRGVGPEEVFDDDARSELQASPLAALEESHRDLERQIKALGPVNLAALGDQQELQERLATQRRQQDDLDQAARDLRQAIARINATSREKFLETFEKVNEKFQEVFPQLLENGHALLRLAEGEDPLEAGVEILAQPAGKKLKHISLLSGGEQALTAIALLLAIFMVKPSPFCLLDEVDAPLDESNIMRFLKVLRRSVGNSQLVMVTHNKRTMEHANNLVGVTMSDPGVSRLISVQLREYQAQAS
ncbi:MAG: chromosome segregation protein SMC [Candidatus Methylomirabilia bacterium]